MVDQPSPTLDDLVKHVGRYPDQAFVFVREGLSYAADQCHGPETEIHRRVYQFVAIHQLDWPDLVARYLQRELPDGVLSAIDQAGGLEKLNRHVDGRQLCLGLRDFALHRWGMMAQTVLDRWNIRSTQDFGRIVFGFIEMNMMQKQADDTLEDFANIYSFNEAFKLPFRDGLNPNPPEK